MNPLQEVQDRYEIFRKKCEYYDKRDIVSLLNPEITRQLGNLRIFFKEIIETRINITNIVKPLTLDLRVWNSLTSRTGNFLKYNLENIKNINDVIKKIYDILMFDLCENYLYFQKIYSEITQTGCLRTNTDLRNFISNLLNFLGDLKKLKLILFRKFEIYKNLIEIRIDVNQDTFDSLKFFSYALKHNPNNTRIYSNIGFLYREFKKDSMNSTYWFIRALSMENDLTKVKDNLDRNFNSIRKEYSKKEYYVDENIHQLKNDLEFINLLFYKIQGILYMNIDTDKLEILMKNFITIMSKILANYGSIGDMKRSQFEDEGFVEQMAILSIFNFHHNLNGLKSYPNENERINLTKDIPKEFDIDINFKIYNHNMLQDESSSKPAFKYCKEFIKNFIDVVCSNLNQDNLVFAEKFFLIIFYWLSLNFDLFNEFFDSNNKVALKFFKFKLITEELKKAKSTETFESLIQLINTSIIPIESMLYGFIPLSRFFELNKKTTILNIEDQSENSKINKIVLIHFLNSFSIIEENNSEFERKFDTSKTFRTLDINVDPSTIGKKATTEKENQYLIPKMIKVTKEKPKILLDASNIAMKHGDNEKYSTYGIKLAKHYFTVNGHEVLAFLPEYLLRSKDESKRKNNVYPDNIDYLKQLANNGEAVITPPQDYDDEYCISYAKQHELFIVTNDMFRDYIEKSRDLQKKEKEKNWMKERLISFSFNKDEFLPNPGCFFFENFDNIEYGKKAKETKMII